MNHAKGTITKRGGGAGGGGLEIPQKVFLREQGTRNGGEDMEGDLEGGGAVGDKRGSTHGKST